MSEITAKIYIGHLDNDKSFVVPTHQLLLTENDRSCLILSNLDNAKSKHIFIIPSPDNLTDDIFLIISVYILKIFDISIDRDTNKFSSISDILTENDRKLFYEQTKESLKDFDIYLSFYLYSGGSLSSEIEKINSYPANIVISSIETISNKTFDGITGSIFYNETTKNNEA